jgi:hypothetical protein
MQRKKTLLVEYKQLRKSNSFLDRRFGGVLMVWLAGTLSGV